MSKSWINDSACGETDLDFYTDGVRETKKCLTLCGTCPVKLECLITSLTTPELYGVWGGTTEEERRIALAVDEDGLAFDYGDELYCPNCRSQDVEPIRKRRVRMTIECGSCSFTWERKRIIRPRKKRESDAPVVNPGVLLP